MENKCLFPSCTKQSVTRGLCKTHYMYALRLVKSGKTTWEELEQSNRCKPPKRINHNTSAYKWFLKSKKTA